MTTSSLPPPFIEGRNGKLVTQQCTTCGFMWAWKLEDIAHRKYETTLDAHMAEHAAVVAVGRRGK